MPTIAPVSMASSPRFEQELFGEGVTHLYRRPAVPPRPLRRWPTHGGAVDTVAPGLGNRRRRRDCPGPPARARKILSFLTSPTAMALTSGFARVLRTNGPPRPGSGRRSSCRTSRCPTTPSMRRRLFGSSTGGKRERVEHRDGARPHGEDVTQDAAHPGRPRPERAR